MIVFLIGLCFPTQHQSLQAVPFTEVTIEDRFWAPRQKTNREVSLRHALDMLVEAGNVDNFELAAKKATKGYHGPVFMDSDLYKGLESVAYSLATHPDKELSNRLDGVIAKMAAAQMPDGYLNTYYQVVEPERRWTNLRDNHELYCAGHLFEAAVAHFRATKKTNLLDIAVKYADHIDRKFGPGKAEGYCGHPEVELALFKLADAAKQPRYAKLAQHFIETRGTHFFAKEHNTPEARYDGTYWQDDVPICDHKNIKGHAVRATYLLSGVTDLVMLTQDPKLNSMLNRVWRNTTEKNTYVTGGIGPSASNEGFTEDYDLPNRSAYQETCASVAMSMWNHRMGLLKGESKYFDFMERALYNGVLSGVSMDGKKYFYVNPLESVGSHHRSGWFGCACCPPNVARTLSALGQYIYAKSDSELYINMFVQGTVKTSVGGKPVELQVQTNYPWDGRVKLTYLKGSGPLRIAARNPGWSKSDSNTADYRHVEISEVGKSTEFEIAMPVQRVAANPNVKDNVGRLAIQRGPLVYCLEGVDQATPISDLVVPREAALKVEDRDWFGGIKVITGDALVVSQPEWNRTLYASAGITKKTSITAIPYYAWDNRKAGPMAVWLPEVVPAVSAGGLAQSAKVGLSFNSGNASSRGINDGVAIKSSSEQPRQLTHFWPHKGTQEWVEYRWKGEVPIKGAEVYWFDDTGRGECRLPQSWKLESWNGSAWVAIPATYGVGLDKWFKVTFPTIKTSALRLVVQSQKGWSVGIHEWKVIEDED